MRDKGGEKGGGDESGRRGAGALSGATRFRCSMHDIGMMSCLETILL